MSINIIVLILAGFMGFKFAKTAGLMWNETKRFGGWLNFVLYAAIIVSAIDFTLLYLHIFTVIVFKMGYVTHEILLTLGMIEKILLVPFLAFTFLVLYLDTFVIWKRRDLESGSKYDSPLGGGYGGYATGAARYTKETSQLPEQVQELLQTKDKNTFTPVITLLLFSLFSGAYTTYAIFMRYKKQGRIPRQTRKERKRFN